MRWRGVDRQALATHLGDEPVADCMRKILRSLASVLPVALWLLLPLPASACSCATPDPDEFLASSPLVFRGKVTSTEPVDPPRADAGDVRSRRRSTRMRAGFRVDKLWKGPASEEVELVYFEGSGASCDWTFRVGQEVTVFAWKTDAGTYTTGLCSMRLTAHPDPRGESPYERVLKSYAATLEGLEQRLRGNPGDVQLLMERAMLFVRYQDHERAEAAFGRLLAVAPRDLAGIVGRGEVRYQTRQYEAALADFDLALAVSPRHPQAQKGRAMTLVSMGRSEQLGAQDRDFSGFQNHKSLSLAGLDLRGASFQGARLGSVDFTGADLRGADFSWADLHKVNFTNAQLERAKFDDLQRGDYSIFKGAVASAASFRRAQLSYVQFGGAVLAGAEFEGARLYSASFKGAIVRGARFKNAYMRGADVSGVQWDGEDLSGADLSGANASGAVLRRVSLRGARIGDSSAMQEVGDWRGADLSEADLTGASWGPILTDCRTRLPPALRPETLPLLPLWGHCPGTAPATALKGGHERQRGPKLDKIQAKGSRLAGRDLSGFVFWSTVMDGSDLRGANLTKVDIQSGSYDGVRLDNAVLVDAAVSRVDFKESSFKGADFSGARLDDVDLSRANLQSARVVNTCFDPRTKWPDGFDAVAAGAKRC